MVGRIPYPGWDRDKISENLDTERKLIVKAVLTQNGPESTTSKIQTILHSGPCQKATYFDWPSFACFKVSKSQAQFFLKLHCPKSDLNF
jgi:hypothetical protein